jgi:dihydroorotase
MRQALECSTELGLPVIDHCEDINLARGGQVNEGKVSRKLHLKGIPAVAEELMVARDIALAGLTGGYLHIAHVSTEGSVELIRQAKEKGINVTAEVTPHHLTLTEDMVKLSDANTKVNPPLRSKKDVAALVQGLKENVIDIIATDHAPHAEMDKQPDYIGAAFGISGLETALGSVMSLVHDGLLDLKTVIASLTTEPARVIGDRFGKLGTLEVGETADIAIFDPDKEWVVDVKEFASKGKNSPLDGKSLRGRAMATISRGKLVYRDDSLKLTEKVVN